MRQKLSMLARGGALLAIAVAMFLPAIGYAGPVYDDDDDRDRQTETELERSAREDREISGQVLEINTLKDPPEMSLATTDGVMRVRMLTKDLIEKNAVRLGDHVTLVGEKISEVEFDCQEMRVEGHLGDEIDNSD